MASRSYGQYCGVTTAVELVGERWAMLIVRDLLVGPRRYTDLKQGLPKIPTNILSTRLKELQEGGVVRRVPLMNCGLVYELTDYGRQLEPIVLALGRWGFAQMGEPGLDDVVTADSLTMTLRTAFRPDAAASLPPADYEVHVGDVTLRVQVDGGELRIAQLAPPAPPVGGALAVPGEARTVVFAAGPGIRRIISGELTPSEAIDQEVVTVVAGDATLLERFAAHVLRFARWKGHCHDRTHHHRPVHHARLVAQAPGGPDEDPAGGFPYGGWQAPLFDEVVGREIWRGIANLDALVLGRKTYDIFASYWPHHTDGVDGAIGQQFNRVPKYVASRGTLDPRLGGHDAAWGRMPRPTSPRCASATRTSTSSAASTSCRRCSPPRRSTSWSCGSTRSCSGRARRSSRTARPPRT